jgi:hypothetical protein
MVVVGLIAILAMAGWRRLGAGVEAKAEAQARCIDALDCGGAAQAAVGGTPPLLGAAAVSGQASPLTSGDDHPNVPDEDASKVQYERYDGKPFVKQDGERHAVDPSDVDQGQLSDCYLVASLGGLALRNPDLIRNAVRDNGDGTYTVTFYEEGFWWWEGYDKVEITVNAEVPMVDGKPLYMQPGEEGEMWPMLVEKAYAEWKGGYDEIEQGGAADALEALTGQESDYDDDFDGLADAWARGDVVTLASADDKGHGPLYQDGTLNTNHEYFVTNVDRDKGTVTLRNPFGYDETDPITLTFEQVEDHFTQMTTNPGGR